MFIGAVKKTSKRPPKIYFFDVTRNVAWDIAKNQPIYQTKQYKIKGSNSETAKKQLLTRLRKKEPDVYMQATLVQAMYNK